MAKQDKGRKLPKQIYVYWEGDGRGDYLMCVIKPGDDLTVGETRLVGVYALRETQRLLGTLEQLGDE